MDIKIETIKNLLRAYYRLKDDKGMDVWARDTKFILKDYYSEEDLESGKANEIKPTTQIEGVPSGFVEMGLVLTFTHDEIDVWEKKILYFLVRDYYIFYSKIPKFDGKTFTELRFYCRPQDEVSIAYRTGILYQMTRKCDKKYFDNAIHSVPDNFPKCIEIEYQKKEVLTKK